ncbi:3-dehydroquinate dehydratase [Microdochium bolleyi]|uniref:3-dehydroquinate dehydratase n=1 Tax=Microdochium bolleyi TaxID=196109 RepID=A0A136JD46_9PEZI|nr:3-dehydroquinate dehydratase [Microdochium bolleyi]
MTTVQQIQHTPPPPRPLSMNGGLLSKADIEMVLDGPYDSTDAFPTTSGAPISSGLKRGDKRTAVIIYGPGQEQIVSLFADVLGKPYKLVGSFSGISSMEQEVVLGLTANDAKIDISLRNKSAVVAINAHCVRLGMPPDTQLSGHCDYEFLYNEEPLCRRDLARFVSFTLGQINHFDALMAKPRTFFLSMTFPDVRAALSNIDILTVGADAVELRVDLLREPLPDGNYAEVPSLSYVGEQVMLLRQRTELPIIYTTRCTSENGRFPMGNPELFYEYLHRAIQWGVEYIDVELWLPEEIRRRLYERRGNSHIMSAFHDFSGTFKWPSEKAHSIFVESRKYADIVKMIAIINEHNENFELEYFRSRIKQEFPDGPPLSAVNMGATGQFSRTLNKVLTPITHPLLPLIAAPGQMSAAEINAALSLLGQLPKKFLYGICGPFSRVGTPHAPFYEKCFNELGLPHHFGVIERQPRNISCVEVLCNQKSFGGAYLTPPISFTSLMHNSTFFSRLSGGTGPTLTEAARMIGVVDTIFVRASHNSAPPSAATSMPSSPRSGESTYHRPADSRHGLPPNNGLVFDNASWRGILSTLTRDLAPSAYYGRTAVVLAANSDDAASTMYALKALRIGKVYTVGFKTPLVLSRGFVVEPFNSLESLQRARSLNDDASPFVIVSALGADKANIVGMLVRVFGGSRGSSPNIRKVFLDLADGPRKGDPGAIAKQSGFAAYGVADTAAFTTVETLRLLVGQNVPYSFVRLASGNGMF